MEAGAHKESCRYDKSILGVENMKDGTTSMSLPTQHDSLIRGGNNATPKGRFFHVIMTNTSHKIILECDYDRFMFFQTGFCDLNG